MPVDGSTCLRYRRLNHYEHCDFVMGSANLSTICTRQAFRWASVAGPFLAVLWAALSPLLLGRGPPARGAAAALAAVERPMFSFFVALGLLGAMNDVKCNTRALKFTHIYQCSA